MEPLKISSSDQLIREAEASHENVSANRPLPTSKDTNVRAAQPINKALGICQITTRPCRSFQVRSQRLRPAWVRWFWGRFWFGNNSLFDANCVRALIGE